MQSKRLARCTESAKGACFEARRHEVTHKIKVLPNPSSCMDRPGADAGLRYPTEGVGGVEGGLKVKI